MPENKAIVLVKRAGSILFLWEKTIQQKLDTFSLSLHGGSCSHETKFSPKEEQRGYEQKVYMSHLQIIASRRVKTTLPHSYPSHHLGNEAYSGDGDSIRQSLCSWVNALPTWGSQDYHVRRQYALLIWAIKHVGLLLPATLIKSGSHNKIDYLLLYHPFLQSTLI